MPGVAQKTAISPVDAPLHLCIAATFAVCKRCPQHSQTSFLKGINARLCKPPFVLPAWQLGWKLERVINKTMVNIKIVLVWIYDTSTQENYITTFCANLGKSSFFTVVNDYVASQADVTPDIVKYSCQSGWPPRKSQLQCVGTMHAEYTAVRKSPTGNSTQRHFKKKSYECYTCKAYTSIMFIWQRLNPWISTTSSTFNIAKGFPHWKRPH